MSPVAPAHETVVAIGFNVTCPRGSVTSVTTTAQSKATLYDRAQLPSVSVFHIDLGTSIQGTCHLVTCRWLICLHPGKSPCQHPTDHTGVSKFPDLQSQRSVWSPGGLWKHRAHALFQTTLTPVVPSAWNAIGSCLLGNYMPFKTEMCTVDLSFVGMGNSEDPHIT